MSGAATNTVVAGPGSLMAVPLPTSSFSVGCWVGTSWLWPKLRPGAPVTVGDDGGGLPVVGGWTGTGAGASPGGRAWASWIFGVDGCAATAAGGSSEPGCVPMVGVNEADTIGVRGGIAATVGGSEPAAFLASPGGAAAIAAAAAAGGTAACGAGVPAAGFCGAAAGLLADMVVDAGVAVMSRTMPAARSASRRLRSSETLSVGDVRDAFLAVALVFCGLGCALGGGWLSPSIAWASRRLGCSAKASAAASASDALARRQIDKVDAWPREGVIAARSGSSG